MELTEKKCAEISKKANDFIKMYKEQLENYDIRDNFLDIALDSFDNEDDMKLFKCFVIFRNIINSSNKSSNYFFFSHTFQSFS